MDSVEIRQATLADLKNVTEIEATCFPAAEAATEKALEERLKAYSKGFFIAERAGNAIGFINGACMDAETIEDRFFESMAFHKDSGKHLLIYGLDVHPDYQSNGYAAQLMRHFITFGKEENKEAILLTCKEHLVSYYERFGYENMGVSASSHGGAKWYDMKLTLNK